MVAGTTTNSGANYSQNSPAGPDGAVIFNASNVQWQVNVNPFTSAAPPQLGAFGVDPNIKMPYAEVFSLGIEQQLSSSTLFTLGYFGSTAPPLLTLFHLNHSLPTRP